MILYYIINNQLQIDKATYIAIVMGQITIYGILLTFYQFVASYQGSQNSMTTYLGVNLIDYFVKMKVSMFKIVVSNPYFFIFFILEVLYKPFLNIYGSYWSMKLISAMNFLWYIFVVFYFIVFIIVLWQCTKSIMMIKSIPESMRNDLIIREINKSFIRKSKREQMTNKSIDLLCSDIENLRYAILVDNDSRLQCKYNHLIDQIFNYYVSSKEKDISNIEKKNKIVKNQVAWVYNSRCEYTLLNEIVNEKYFPIDEELKEIICWLHIRLVKLNIKRAELNGYEHINSELYVSNFFNNNNNLLDCCDWIKLTSKIYKNSNIEIREKLISSLQSGYLNNQGMYQEYCSDCIELIISMEIDEIFEGRKLQSELTEVFSKVIKNEELNDYYAIIIRDKLISYNHFDAGELVKLLNEENCACVFAYIIIYYSIYKFRFDWKYINIGVLEALWQNYGNIQVDSEKVIETFEKSNINHRFSEEMYNKLTNYIQRMLTGSLLDSIYKDSIVDMFYVTIIKLCVLDQDYIGYVDEVKADTQIYFINELSKHNELMMFDKVKKMVSYMQYNYFMNLDYIPQKLTISLRNLLLTNINLTSEILSDKKYKYLYYDSIGKYVLIKLSEKSKDNDIQKELIRKAFITSNMSIDDYMDLLNQECHICGCDLNYVQKENMKKHLVSII